MKFIDLIKKSTGWKMVKANITFVTHNTQFLVEKDREFKIVVRRRGLYKIQLTEDLVSDWFDSHNELLTVIE